MIPNLSKYPVQQKLNEDGESAEHSHTFKRQKMMNRSSHIYFFQIYLFDQLTSPTLCSKIFLEGNRHTLNVVAVPQGLKNRVTESQNH